MALTSPSNSPLSPSNAAQAYSHVYIRSTTSPPERVDSPPQLPANDAEMRGAISLQPSPVSARVYETLSPSNAIVPAGTDSIVVNNAHSLVAPIDDAAIAGTKLEAVNEPAFEWRPAAMRRYYSWWFGRARRFTAHRLSPSRIRREWTKHDTHVAIQVVYTGLTFVLFFLLYYFHAFAAHVPGYGRPQDITCHAIAWGGCGLNAGDCQPFETRTWQALRCPHRCTLFDTSGEVLGGRNRIYRADSHICASALHAGITHDSTGGCFLYRRAGAQNRFPSTGTNAGVTSETYPSWFPGSIQLASVGSQYCENFGVAILFVGIVWLLPLACMRPHAMLLWFLLLYFGYWYIALTLVDGSTPRSLFWQGTLNCLFLGVFGYVLYHAAPKHTLHVPRTYAATADREFPWRLVCPAWRHITKRFGPRVRTSQPLQDHRILVSSVSAPPSRESLSLSNNAVDAPKLYEVPATPSLVAAPPALAASSATLAIRTDADPMPTSVGESTSPLGSQQTAAQHVALHLPLIPQSDMASPSPSPSPLASPPATSVHYYPPTFGTTEPRRRFHTHSMSDSTGSNASQDGEATHDQAAGYSSVASAVASSGHPAPRAALIPKSTPATSDLVLRPWYELYFLYTLPLILALHFSYLVYIPGVTDVDLSATFFTHGPGGILLIVAIILVLLVVLVYHVRMAFRVNLLFRYLLYYLYAVAIIVFVSVLFAATADFHLHHVLAGLLLIPISRFQSRVSLVFQAIATGIFLNGLAMWNFTVSWDVHNPRPPANPFNTRPQLYQLQNSTASTVLLAWPAYSPHSDAIGATLRLNGIEIFHSAYDVDYGGGYTPYNKTRAYQQSMKSLGRVTTSRSAAPPGAVASSARSTSDGPGGQIVVVQTTDPEKELLDVTIQLPSMIRAFALPSPDPLASGDYVRTPPVRAGGEKDEGDDVTGHQVSLIATQHVQLPPRSTARINLAAHDHSLPPSRHAVATFYADPQTTKSKTRALHPVHTAREFASSSSAGDASRPTLFAGGQLFYVFELTNLRPNTSYEVQAGYTLANGGAISGPAGRVTTSDTPP